MAPPAYSPPLSPQTSHSPSTTSPPDNVALQLQLQRSKSASTVSSTTSTTWTTAQESRLLHCQTELHSAQKRWSASQELWIEEVEQLSEMKKKHFKAIKKQDQDIRTKKAVGIWKRKTWKSLSRKGSGAATPVTEPVTRAGSEDEAEDGEGDEDDEEDEAADEYGEIKMGPIRRRSEGVTVDLPSSRPPSRPATSSNPPSPRRPSIAVTLRKLSVPGIKRRSTAPEGEGFGGSGSIGGVLARSPTDLGGGAGLVGSGLKRRVVG